MAPEILNATWMQHATCRVRPELPWTIDSADVSAWDALTMRTVCDRCPVRAACVAMATTDDVYGGWWAGADRAADAEVVPSPSWVPVRDGVSQGVLPLRTGTAA